MLKWKPPPLNKLAFDSSASSHITHLPIHCLQPHLPLYPSQPHLPSTPHNRTPKQTHFCFPSSSHFTPPPLPNNAFKVTSLTGTLFEISSSKSSSFDSNPSRRSSIPKYKWFFSSLKMFILSEVTQLAPSLLTLHIGTPHRYYQEINLF